jgi:hypothetical protein
VGVNTGDIGGLNSNPGCIGRHLSHQVYDASKTSFVTYAELEETQPQPD